VNFDNSNIIDKVSNASNVRFLHSHNNINDSERDFSCGDSWFSDDYGIFFFIKERRKHYNNLNNEILKPLTQLNLNKKLSYSETLFDYAKYSIGNVKDLLLYKYALKHLSIDRPNFDLDFKLENLKQSLENHNEKVENLEKEIPQIIKNKFRISYSTLRGRQYPYTESSINSILKNRFKQYYDNSTSDKIIDNINTYSTKETYKEKNFANGIVRIGGIRIAEDYSLTENDGEQYIEIMDKLVKNESISNKLKEIKESNENLELEINEVKQEINQIVEAIDRDLYDTKANCCPTFLRVIRNYFF